MRMEMNAGDKMKGIQEGKKKMMGQRRERKIKVLSLGKKQRILSQEKGLIVLRSRMTEKKQRGSIELVLKKVPKENKNAERMRRRIDQDIKMQAIQAGTKEGVLLPSAVRVETVKTTQLVMPMIQVMTPQTILKGSCNRENVTYHHHLSGLGEGQRTGK
ncbi:hypothetical protein RGQ29_015450 [Quercus rubra]|uniref:Uncharacterized protein n=1 Tax=Quercus rubra TaxID=3512 RepID=A0AAN7FWD7_QUERU|nr:hypothetical protein RGQ29_015450 [Quercus rubra]